MPDNYEPWPMPIRPSRSTRLRIGAWRALYLWGIARAGIKPTREAPSLARAAGFKPLELDETPRKLTRYWRIIAAVLDY
jgi:hypothetical protein